MVGRSRRLDKGGAQTRAEKENAGARDATREEADDGGAVGSAAAPDHETAISRGMGPHA